MVDSILSYEQLPEEDFYQVLGCSETSSNQQIIKEFNIRARKHHPDKNLDNSTAAADKFLQLQRAKEVLTDPSKRKDYDKWRYSNMAIPYHQWSQMSPALCGTMHWAPRQATQPMIGDTIERSEFGADIKPKWDENGNFFHSVGSAIWRRQTDNDLLRKFRNYEI